MTTLDTRIPISHAAPAANFRPFLAASILTGLTAGAAWGVYLLYQIGVAGSFTQANALHPINAHGHAQIFGWAILFIMGVATALFPRLLQTPLATPRVSPAVFALMLVGLLARTLGMAFANTWPHALPAAMIGGAMEIAAILLFVSQMVATWRQSSSRFSPATALIAAALFWLVVQAIFSTAHTYNTLAAGDASELLWFVATYQAPLRDTQLHGLALCMILGVSAHLLPGLLHLPALGPRRLWTTFFLVVPAVFLETCLFLLYRHLDHHVFAALLLLPWLMLLVGAWIFATPWLPWRRLPQTEKPSGSRKFIRSAYLWLILSLTMLAGLPVYQALHGRHFSHAYYGAIRHAFTVGFLSMMILGVASHLVPTLCGTPARRSPQHLPFMLLTLGCALRVATQIATDWHAGVFPIMAISGVLELTALAIWGTSMLKCLVSKGTFETADGRG